MKLLKVICMFCIFICTNGYTYKTQPLGMPLYGSTSKHLPLCKENSVNNNKNLCRCTTEGQLEVYLIRQGQSCMHGKFSLGDIQNDDQVHHMEVNKTTYSVSNTYSYKDQPLGIPTFNSSYPLCEENAENTGNEICQCTSCKQIEIYLIRPGQSCIDGNFSLIKQTPCNTTSSDIQGVIDAIDNCQPCPEIPADVQEVLDMIDDCDSYKPCPEIPSDIQQVLDMIGDCGSCTPISDDIQGVIDAIQDCQPKYDPCEGLREHCSCLQCDPKDTDCAETKDIKSCQYDNSSLVCKTATEETKQCDKYDPCEDKGVDCYCNLCPPGDSTCFETDVIKTCQKEKNKLVCKMSTSGKLCEPCNIRCAVGYYLDDATCSCKPCTADKCQATCSSIDCDIYDSLELSYVKDANKDTCCDTRDCRRFDCRGLYKNTKQVSVDLTKDNCCERNMPVVEIAKIEAKQQEVMAIFPDVEDEDMEEFSTTITKAVQYDEASESVVEPDQESEQAPFIRLNAFKFEEKRTAVTTEKEKKEFIIEKKILNGLIVAQIEAQRTKEVVRFQFKAKDAPVSPDFKNELTKRNVSTIDVSTPKRKPSVVTCDDADVHLEKISKSGAFTVLLPHEGNSSVKCMKNTLATRMTLVEKNTADYNYYNVDCYNNNTKQWETTHSRLKEEDKYTCPITGKYIGNVGSDSGAFAGCDDNFAPTNGNDGDCTELDNGESCQPGCNSGYIVRGQSTCVGNNEFDPQTVCERCASPKLIVNNECICPFGWTGANCNQCDKGFANAFTNDFCWKCDMKKQTKYDQNGNFVETKDKDDHYYQDEEDKSTCRKCEDKRCDDGETLEGCGFDSAGKCKECLSPKTYTHSNNILDRTCECPSGWKGDQCDQCVHNPCIHAANCTFADDIRSDYVCHCETGWTGKNCTDDIKECDSNAHNCHANATCVEDSPGFKCECPVGFFGDGQICTPCSDGFYQNVTNQPNCIACKDCGPGFVLEGCGGDNPGQCVDINGCDSNSCSSTSTCVDTPAPAPGTNYTCNCELGWAGEFCDKDIYEHTDECLGDHGCDANAECVDDRRGFHCECKAGYAGDNTTCTPCNSGDYQDLPNQASCKVCAGGVNGTTGISGAYTSCSDCGSGFGKKDDTCIACEASSYQWHKSVNAESCNTHDKCDIGYGYKHVNKIDACLKCNSTFEYSNINGWLPCVSKKTSCSTIQLLVKHPLRNTHDDVCDDCPPGYQCDGSASKIQCQKGYFSENAVCKPCPAGTYSLDGATQCTRCGDDSKYSDTNSSSCTDCPPGSFTSGGAEKTREKCTICPKGHRCDGTSVKSECTDNNYAAEGQSTCSECEKGYWPNLQRSSCDWCDLGWGKNNSKCEECQDPYFSYTQSDSPCVYFTCPKGQGVHSSGKCQECVLPAFSDSNHTGTCETLACPKGTFFKWTNTSTRPECLSCPENTFMDEYMHHNQTCKPHAVCEVGYGGIATAEQDRTCLECPTDVSFSSNNECVAVSDIDCGENQYYVPGTSTADRHCESCPERTFKTENSHKDTVCEFTYLKIVATGSAGLTSDLDELFTKATSSDVQVTPDNGTYTIEISKPLSSGNQFPDISQERETATGLTFSGVDFDFSQSPCINKAPQDGSFGQCPHILQANETCQPSCKSGFTLHRGPVCAHAVLKEPICIYDFETDLLDGILTEEELIAVKEQNTNRERFITLVQNKALNISQRRRVFKYIFDYENTPFQVSLTQAQLHPNTLARLSSRNIQNIQIVPPQNKPALNCSYADIDIQNAPRAFEIPLQYESDVALICRKNALITKMRLESNKYKVSCYENNQWGAEFEKLPGDTYHCGHLEFFVNSLGSSTCQMKLLFMEEIQNIPRMNFGDCPQTLVEGESCQPGCNYFYEFNTGPATCSNGIFKGSQCVISCEKIYHDWDNNCCGARTDHCKKLLRTFQKYGCCSRNVHHSIRSHKY